MGRKDSLNERAEQARVIVREMREVVARHAEMNSGLIGSALSLVLGYLAAGHVDGNDSDATWIASKLMFVLGQFWSSRGRKVNRQVITVNDDDDATELATYISEWIDFAVDCPATARLVMANVIAVHAAEVAAVKMDEREASDLAIAFLKWLDNYMSQRHFRHTN